MMKHILFVVWLSAGRSIRRCAFQGCIHVLVGCLIVLDLAFSSASMANENVPAATWNSDFEKAELQSKERGVPIVIHFYAHWCGPCRTMESEILESAEVRTVLRGGIVGVKIDADDRQDLVRRFGVSALPTDIIVSPDGLVLTKDVGSPGLQAYVARLTQFSVVRNVLADNKAIQVAHASRRVNIAGNSVTESVRTEAGTMALRRESKDHFGLHGFSPVSLTESETWRVGDSRYRHEFQGVSYHLSSAEELDRFKASPEKFVPALHGCDPVALVNDQVVQAGYIELGVTWRSKVYFFYSKETRDAFLRNPEKFVQLNNLTFFSNETQG